VAFKNILNNLHTQVPEIDAITITNFVNRRYQSLLRSWQWSFLKDRAVLTTVNPYSTGTVTVSNGSVAVTGSGTTWTSAMLGRQFRASSLGEFYEIASVESATSLSLRYAYGGNTASGAAYSIFQHIYSLVSTATKIQSIVYRFPLKEANKESMDQIDAERKSTGTPQWFIYLGKDSSGYQQVEIHPVPAAAYTLRYEFYKSVSDMVLPSDVPVIREDLVEAAALIDCYRYAARTIRDYLPLLGDARLEFVAIKQEALEEDIRVESQRNGVVNVYAQEPLGRSSFWVDHDPGVF
jgi:hypothetical protein